jgi:hypothetical protein
MCDVTIEAVLFIIHLSFEQGSVMVPMEQIFSFKIMSNVYVYLSVPLINSNLFYFVRSF